MAKKKLEEKIIKIKKSIDDKKAVFGINEVLSELRISNLTEVLLASNCTPEMENEVNSLADKTPVLKLERANDELGVICKKPFSISVIGIKK